MLRLTRRRLAVPAAIIAGVFATSACSAEVGAAAVVDGKRIEVATVQDALVDLEDIADGLTQTDVLSMLVIAPIWVDIGSDYGVGFTDQEVEETLEILTEQAGVESHDFSPGAVEVLRSDMILSALTNSPSRDEVIAEVQERIDRAEIESNPRFGTFTSQSGLQPVTPDWLVDSPANPLDIFG